MKRALDLGISALALVALSPLLLLVGFLVKLETPGPVFFRHTRLGKNFVPFDLIKFRTMRVSGDEGEIPLSAVQRSRITRVGRFLRRTKIDELPQLVNVLKGEMSLVGPRPEVPRYVDAYMSDFEEILRVPPGVTDLASLKYRHESDLLERSTHPEEDYLREILPDKIRLAKEYIERSSVLFDLKLIGATLVKMFHGNSAR